ncbi:hypothetical protein D3C73_486470 [compost metagenome]
MTIVDWAKKGSICTVAGSGMSTMSDSLIAFQPPIEEPSKHDTIGEHVLVDGGNIIVTCCSLPRGSVKRRSTNFTSFSLICFMISLALVITGSSISVTI